MVSHIFPLILARTSRVALTLWILLAGQNAAAARASVDCSPQDVGAIAEIYADVEVKDAEAQLRVLAAVGEGDGMGRDRGKESGGKDLPSVDGSIPMKVMFSRAVEIRSEPDPASTGKCRMRLSSGTDNFMVLQERSNGRYGGTIKIATDSDYKIGGVSVARMLGVGTVTLRCIVDKTLSSRVCDKGEVIVVPGAAGKNLPEPTVR